VYFKTKIGLSKITITHERKIYGFFDVLGDFGGVL
jgi:hypothetical protein